MMDRWVTGFAVMTTCLMQANAAELQHTRASLQLVDKQILPAAQTFVTSTSALAEAAHGLCHSLNLETLDTTRQAFHETADAWQHIQWLRKGPAELSLRHQRIALWPDKHGAVARALRKLLSDRDSASLEQPQFGTGSVAVQGLPALERLLFDDEATTDLLGNSESGFTCLLVLAITSNLKQIAIALDTDWRQLYRDAIATPGSDNPFFDDPSAVTAELMSQQVTQLQLLLEQKLERPLNISPETDMTTLRADQLTPRPRRAENWRSARTLRNVAINLDSLDQAWQLGLRPLVNEEANADRISAAFDFARSQFAPLPDRLETALDEHPQQMIIAVSSVRALYEVVQRDLPLALDIPLGFNSLDGD